MPSAAEDVLKKKAAEFSSRNCRSLTGKSIVTMGARRREKGRRGGHAGRIRHRSAGRDHALEGFSGHHKHHRLLSGVLAQIKTKAASRDALHPCGLSFDEKARVTATPAHGEPQSG